MRRISRRTALATGGSVGLGALLAACGGDGGTVTPTGNTTVPTTTGGSATVSPQTSTSTLADLFPDAASCTLTPEQTEGPYYFDVNSIRSDIREDRPGTRLRLAMRVQDASCRPISNAVVDVWHSDASGVYSGFEAGTGKQFLRGAQVTNAEGIVEFVTVYPGWYRGRTVHIHFKVHINNDEVLTSQLFFDEAVSSEVYATAPYTARTDRDQFNDDDNIFDPSLVTTTRPDGDGYLSLMSITVRGQAG